MRTSATDRASPRSSTTTSRAAPPAEAAAIDWPLPALAVVLATAVAFDDGGYFPPAWGWSSLALLWVAAIALFLRDRLSLGRLELAMLASLAAFVGWVALSSTWSTSFERSVLEVQRDLVYFAALLVVLLVARGRAISELLAAVCTVSLATSAFALANFFFGDRLSARDAAFVRLEGFVRLSKPLGYPNAVALVATIGALLAAGFAAHGRSQLQRASSAACLVVFVLTIY